MNNENTTPSTTNTINNNLVEINIDELVTPIGVSLKGLHFKVNADYSDDVNRTQCSLVKSLISDYIAPLVNRGIDHLEKEDDRRNARRDEERKEEHEAHNKNMEKIQAEIDAIRNGNKKEEE